VVHFFDTEDAFDPVDDLMGGRVDGFVEVEDTAFEVLDKGAFEGRIAGGDRSVVIGVRVEVIVVFEKDRPLGSVDW